MHRKLAPSLNLFRKQDAYQPAPSPAAPAPKSLQLWRWSGQPSVRNAEMDQEVNVRPRTGPSGRGQVKCSFSPFSISLPF